MKTLTNLVMRSVAWRSLVIIAILIRASYIILTGLIIVIAWSTVNFILGGKEDLL